MRSLRASLLLLMVVPVLPLLVLCAAAIWFQWRADVEQVRTALVDTANAVAFAVDGEIETSRAIVDTLAGSPLIDARDWRAFHKLASDAIRDRANTFIALTEPSGLQPVRTLLPFGQSPSVNPLAVGQADVEYNGVRLPLSTQDLSKRVFDTGRMANSELYYGMSLKKPGVSIGVPVQRDGAVPYVLIIGFTVERLAKVLQDATNPQMRISIIDGSGRIIARTQDPGGTAVGIRVADSVAAALKAEDRGVRDGVNTDGQPTLGAFRRLRMVDWTVYASVPKDVAYERARNAVLVWAALGALFVLVGVLGATSLWRKIAPPLLTLGHSALAMQRGERPPLPRSDIREIDELTVLLKDAAAMEKREREEIILRKAAEQSERVTRDLFEALAESERRFRVLFEQSGVGIAAVDLDARRFTLVNAQLAQITGYGEDELLAQPTDVFLHQDDRAPNAATFDEFRTGARDAFDGERRAVRKDGTPIWIEVHARRLAGATPETAVAFVSVIDITARKNAEVALVQANRRKDEFLAVLAHELRNPLAPLRNGLEIIRNNDRDPERIAHVRALMERQVQYMVRLIDDLLDVSRITTGKIQLKTAAIDLRAVVRAAVEVWRPAADAGGQALDERLPPDAVLVDGDHTRLVQVVGNLLDNAIKYSERPGRITVGVERRGTHARITVRDTGVGIPRDAQREIFELFSQVRNVQHRSSNSGLGIGLHLVRQLVELHHGTIEVASAGEGAGSEFTIDLPVLPAAAPAVALQGGERPAGNAGLSVLIVDDNRDAAESTAMLLAALGHDARAAFNGASALELVAHHPPQLVLLDIGMPGMDGYEVARRMRAMPQLAATWIVALSGWDQPEDHRMSAAAGFDLHLAKPVDLPDLERLLQRLARHHEPSTAATSADAAVRMRAD